MARIVLLNGKLGERGRMEGKAKKYAAEMEIIITGKQFSVLPYLYTYFCHCWPVWRCILRVISTCSNRENLHLKVS